MAILNHHRHHHTQTRAVCTQLTRRHHIRPVIYHALGQQVAMEFQVEHPRFILGGQVQNNRLN
jgi:hypothetical protein